MPPTSASPVVTRLDPADPTAPAWIELRDADRSGDGTWQLARTNDWTYARYQQRDDGASGKAFVDSISTLYGRLHALLRDCPAKEPLRFWNYIPHIHSQNAPGEDRYMAFNAGRHRALTEWLKSTHIAPRLVAASAVGHDGSDVIVEVFCGTHAPKPIENPRQRPAYRYSQRYGAVSPSFARATLVDLGASRSLITAGTASVVGEDSVHIGDVPAQLREIELNLAALIDESSKHGGAPTVASTTPGNALKLYRHLRAYIVQASDEPLVARWIEEKFPGLESVEWVQADLCRRDLLVEVEGVAVLP